MATNQTIKPRRGTSAPGVGAINQNELAVDTTNKRIYIGAADGSGTLIGSAPGGSDTQVQFNDNGVMGGDSGLTYNKTTDTLTVSNISTTGCVVNTVGGDEGGEIILGKAVTNTTLVGTGVTIDVYQNKLRFFEQGGTARGFYLDISNGGAGVATNLQASSASPGGSDTYVQFNDGGSTFGGDAGLTYNKTTDTLTIAGDLAVNGGDLTCSATTFNLLNATVTTMNFGGAATAMTMGDATSSTVTIRGGTLVGNLTTQNLFNTTATTLNLGGAATAMTMGDATSSTVTIRGGTLVGNLTTQNLFNTTATTLNLGGAATAMTMGDATSSTVTIRGGTLVGNLATQNLFNTTATTLNLGGAATAMTMGDATSSTVTIRGGTLVGNLATQNLFNTTATTLNLGGAATTLTMGASASTTTTIRGGTLVGNTTTQNLFNTTATTVNFAGAATTLTMGATTGTAAIKNATTKFGNTTATISTSNNGVSTSTNHLTVSPYGNLTLSPTADATIGGDRPSVVVQNSDNGTGVVQISGGDLYLATKTDAVESTTAVSIIFEGATDDGFETTLTVTDPTADRTITLPNATGTVALTANKLSVFASTSSSELAGVISDETGSGSLVFATSPTLVTPTLGVASATSINKVAVTAPATSATLTIADGKTLTASNTLTFTGTDSSSVAFGSGGTVSYLATAQTFTAIQSFGQGSTGAGEIRLLEDTDDGSNYTGLRGSARSANITYVMPTTDPTEGQVLSATAPSSNVSTLSWTTPSGGGLTWTATTADATMAVDNGYLANKSTGTLTLTLPSTSAVGKVIRVSGMQNTWRVAQGASQKINFGKTTTTTGTGGYIESTNARDAVELVCCVANTEWNVISSVGNITIV